MLCDWFTKFEPPPIRSRTEINVFFDFFFSFSRQAEEAVSCDPVCENSCEKISVQIPPKDGKIAENEEERKRQPIVTESIEVQTEPITVEELLSFQQQKL